MRYKELIILSILCISVLATGCGTKTVKTQTDCIIKTNDTCITKIPDEAAGSWEIATSHM